MSPKDQLYQKITFMITYISYLAPIAMYSLAYKASSADRKFHSEILHTA